MKKSFYVVLFLSLCINALFIYFRIRFTPYNFEDAAFPAFDLYSVNVTKEKMRFLIRLKSIHPKVFEKKLLFLQFWCRNDECLYQIPVIDTLVQNYRDKFAFVCVCNEKPSLAALSLREKKIQTKNFFYINESDTFMHAIWRESGRKSFPFAGRLLPMNVIMTDEGKVLYIDSLPAFSGFKMDTTIDRKHAQILKNALKNLH
jgi:hypothetical protein